MSSPAQQEGARTFSPIPAPEKDPVVCSSESSSLYYEALKGLTHTRNARVMCNAMVDAKKATRGGHNPRAKNAPRAGGELPPKRTI